MKTTLLFIVSVLIIQNEVFSQSCLPDGIVFTTQTQIDSFQINYPNCTKIEGDVIIAGGTYIDNLNGLNGLTSIGGYLAVSEFGPMSNFIGLENLTSIEGSFILGNNFDAGSCSVTDFTGLENLNSIGGNLEVYDTHNLLNFSGLNNLTSVNGNIHIGTGEWGHNYGLVSLDGLENIDAHSVSNIYIYNNPNLSMCSIKSICDFISNPNGDIYISNAQGCSSVNEVEESCEATSLTDNSAIKELYFYPNPTTLEISLSSSITRELQEVNIYNQHGQVVLRTTECTDKIDISKIGKGLFIIEVTTNRLNIREKLIIK